MNTSLILCFSILLVSCVIFSHAENEFSIHSKLIREKRGLGMIKQAAGGLMKKVGSVPLVGGALSGLLGGKARIDTYDQYNYDDGNEMRERMDTENNINWQQYSDYDYNDD